MKLRFLSLLLSAAGVVGAASAQQVTISPIPQSITWGTKAFDSASASYSITGESDADQDAIRVFKSNFKTGGAISLIIGERDDAAVASYAAKIPQKAEGYYLKVEADKVVIAGNDERGTFYGVQSFLQIAKSPEVMQCEITDYPDVPDRGVIEGFYGNPWSTADRESQFEFYGANKMNVYVYGPKDDPYHRASWRLPYPTDQANALSALAKKAAENKVQFVWALHPGNDIKWNKTDSLNVVNKLEKMYDLGIRTFAIFFDDISGEGAKGEKQAGLMNYVTEEFVNKHSDVAQLLLCPTEYNRAWAGNTYLPALRTYMNKNVRVMWTGNSVVDMINKSDMEWINGQIGSKAYIWLNYPVTDYCDRHMLMGPTFGNDNNIADMLSGFCSNPMEYAEASKLSLYSIADYSWNLSDYDSNASWERAIEYLMPKYVDAFHVFCENNVDLGANYHGLRRQEGESPAFRTAKAIFETATEKGYNEAAYNALKAEYTKLVTAADVLLNARDDMDANNALLNEIAPWCEVMKCIGQRGENAIELMKAYEAGDTVRFIDLYKANVEIEQKQGKIRSRDFAGSIKNPNPVVADVVVGPYIKQLTAKAVEVYRKKYTYGTDNFPSILLEDGNYYIMYNGKYLTNNNPNGSGGNPTFASDVLDNINPQKMEWIITMDYDTQRYKIVNAYDNRVLNELGAFSVNPYEAIWHTYNIRQYNGKYAIQNSGSAGDKFWNVANGRINMSGVNKLTDYEYFFFEIVPVGGEKKNQVIEEGKAYCIINPAGKYLTNRNPNPTGVADRPYFDDKIADDTELKQGWTINFDSTTKRYNVLSAADKRYLNEKGTFAENAAWNPYEAIWHTYIITGMGDTFSIQNSGSAGTNFWSYEGELLGAAITNLNESYIFRIVPHDSWSGINAVKLSNAAIKVKEGEVVVTGADVKSIAIIATDGKTVATNKASQTINVSNIASGCYIVVVTTPSGMLTTKVAL